MSIEGRLTGRLILAFDDASGWALTELLLELAPDPAQPGAKLDRSAVLETTNIVGCGYLNSLSRRLQRLGEPPEPMPSPQIHAGTTPLPILQALSWIRLCLRTPFF